MLACFCCCCCRYCRGRHRRHRRRRRHQMVHIVERLYLSRHEQEACEILATDEIPGYTARGNIWQLLARRVRVRAASISVESTTAHARVFTA